MDAVEGASQDEVVVRVELLQTRSEVAIVDESAGFVDDEQREDDPAMATLEYAHLSIFVRTRN